MNIMSTSLWSIHLKPLIAYALGTHSQHLLLLWQVSLKNVHFMLRRWAQRDAPQIFNLRKFSGKPMDKVLTSLARAGLVYSLSYISLSLWGPVFLAALHNGFKNPCNAELPFKQLTRVSLVPLETILRLLKLFVFSPAHTAAKSYELPQ